MYALQYFKSGDSICGSDLDNILQTEYINLQQISSLSDVKRYLLPLSGTYIGDYAVVRMQNGDKLFINRTEHSKLKIALDCYHNTQSVCRMKFKDAPVGARFKYPNMNTIFVKLNSYPKGIFSDGRGLICKWNGNIEWHQSFCSFVDEESGIDFDTVVELV